MDARQMVDLSENGLKSWFDKLPEDFQDSIASEIPKNVEGVEPFAKIISEAEPAQFIEILNKSTDVIESIGRIGRIRLLSFICDKVYPFQAKVFHQILDEEEDSSGGSTSIKTLFIEDIKAFNEAVSKRVYKSNIDNVALKALQEAAFENAIPDGPF
jgi:hypothetical protein